MAAEEFQESDIIFADNFHNDNDDCNHDNCLMNLRSKAKMKKMKNNNNNMASSLPVNIPDHHHHHHHGVLQFTDSEDEYCDDNEVVPPHLIVARRVAGKMAFSVCTGNGRTLKGRDLSQVRNSILRMTGFLET